MKLFAVACMVAASLGSLAAQVYKVGNGVSLPVVVTRVNPQYTEDAKKARLEGIVGLNATVLANGSVSDVKVIRSLDSTFGLDQEAAKALRQWTFKPGLKDGKPVAVNIDVEMNFTLK